MKKDEFRTFTVTMDYDQYNNLCYMQNHYSHEMKKPMTKAATVRKLLSDMVTELNGENERPTLRQLREKNNTKATHFANELNITRQQFMQYESGNTRIPVEIIDAFLKKYNVKYEDIDLSPNHSMRARRTNKRRKK